MDPATIAILMNAANTAAPYVKNLIKDETATRNSKAYQDYLNGFSSNMADTLQNRASSYEGKLGDMSSEAESQYLGEANTPLAELSQMKTDIANKSSEAQRQNRLQVQNNLNASGVRGGQAAILQNRATGELDRDLGRDVNSLAYDEASNRQNSRLGYYGTKDLTPWYDLSQTYCTNSSSASSALSQGQGDAMTNAYNLALKNFTNTQKKGIFT